MQDAANNAIKEDPSLTHEAPILHDQTVQRGLRLPNSVAAALGGLAGGALDGLVAWLWGPLDLDPIGGLFLVAVGAAPPMIGAAVLSWLLTSRTQRLRPATWLTLSATLALGASVALCVAQAQAPPLALVAFAVLGALATVLSLVLGRLAWLAPAASVLLLPAGFVRLDPGPRDKAVNVLIVSVDALRADSPPEGGTWSTLAARGVRFDRAISPTTRSGPAHAALHTGRGPWDDGLRFDGQPVPPAATLAEHYSVLGYRTAAFVSSDLVTGRLGFNRGFAVYDDDFTWIRGLDRVGPGRVWVALSGAWRPSSRRAAHTAELASTWLAQADSPWFCWVQLHDATGPYDPPVPFDGRHGRDLDPHTPDAHMSRAIPHAKEHGTSLDHVRNVQWVRTRYRGEVDAIDAALEPIIEAVNASGRPTVIVLTGAYGQALGEHERWFRHGGLGASEAIVPLVVVAPDVPPASVPWPVELTDLAPTVLQLSEQPESPSHTGRSLKHAMQTGTPTRHTARTVVWQNGVQASVRGLRGAWQSTPTNSSGWRSTPDGERQVHGASTALVPLQTPTEQLQRQTTPSPQPSMLPDRRIRQLGGLPPPTSQAP